MIEYFAMTVMRFIITLKYKTHFLSSLNDCYFYSRRQDIKSPQHLLELSKQLYDILILFIKSLEKLHITDDQSQLVIPRNSAITN